MSPGTTNHTHVRLLAAVIAAAAIASTMGPDDISYTSYVMGLSLIVALGGWILFQTDEGALSRRIATGALGCLLLAPAIGIRVSRVNEAIKSVEGTAPHEVIASLPGIAASVVQTTGPLLLAGGVALLILGGRLSATVAGAILGGATAAWAGQTMAMEIGHALEAERFDQVVLLSQGMQGVGLLAVLGALAGMVLARQGQRVLIAKRMAALKEEKRRSILQQRQDAEDETKRLQATANAKDANEISIEGLDDAPQLDLGGNLDIGMDASMPSPISEAEFEAIHAALYATPLLHALDDAEIDTIARSFEKQHFDDDENLFLEQDHDRTIFIICRGEVQIWKQDASDQRFALARLSAGMLFGEMAVIENRQRSASATACGKVEVITLSGDAYSAIAKSQPRITTKIQLGLLKEISERLRHTSADLISTAEGMSSSSEAPTEETKERTGDPVEAKDISALMGKSRIFREISSDELNALAPLITKMTFASGEHLLQAGAIESSMLVIQSGRVDIWRENSDQQKVVLATIEQGISLGEMALIEDGPGSATATAIGEVAALLLTRDAIRRLTEEQPEIAVKLYQALLEVLSQRLRRTSSNLVDASIEEADRDLQFWDESSPSDALDEAEQEDAPEEEEGQEEAEEEIIVAVTPEEVNPDAQLSPSLITQQRRIAGGLAILAAIVSAWAASPPWMSLIQPLPSPATGLDVPTADPGLANAQRPLNPFGGTFHTALKARGHDRLHSRPWPCLPDAFDKQHGYGSLPRNTETLAVTKDTAVVELTPAIQALRKQGIYRMGLTGAATPPYGLLGEFLAWPSVQFLIDSPPRTVQWIELHPRHLKKLPLLPGATTPRACALLVDEEVTIDHLYATARSLGSAYGDPSCSQAMILVLPDDGSTTNSHPGWRGCP